MTRAARGRTAALHMKWPLQAWLWKFAFGEYGRNSPFPLLGSREGCSLMSRILSKGFFPSCRVSIWQLGSLACLTAGQQERDQTVGLAPLGWQEQGCHQSSGPADLSCFFLLGRSHAWFRATGKQLSHFPKIQVLSGQKLYSDLSWTK